MKRNRHENNVNANCTYKRFVCFKAKTHTFSWDSTGCQRCDGVNSYNKLEHGHTQKQYSKMT